MNTDHAFLCKTMELASSPNAFYFEFCRKAMPKELTNTQEIITSGEKFVITITPSQAKSMLVMLDQAVMKYEATFGSLKCPIDNVDKTVALDKLIEQLLDYLNLKEDWDGYGGMAPFEKTVNETIQFVKTLPKMIPLPEPMIASSGVIGLYWDDKGIYAEIGFEGDGTFWCYAEDAEGHEAGEDSIPVGEELPPDLLNILAHLTKG
ncbi:MAG: hypothetical protein DRR16_20240 [Candidatus Parabeggiatoa sp. nov. 3]|nr:MAG: hypothetical protein DRR00_33280 [Gammaproteobacteria bacterium]RKZ82193.1 MAG: hypothetical protein DRR16_20240 [Gammaproteobacteria bacterium]